MIRFRAPYADPLILPCVIALNGLGLAMIHRLDLVYDPPSSAATTQFIWSGLGMVLFAIVLVFFRDVRRFERFTYLMFLGGFFLLMLPLAPGIGVEKFGARIWIQVGGFSLQPSEIAKILLAFAFASYMVNKREVLALSGFRLGPLHFPRLRDLGPIAIMWAAAMAILVFQKDLGTALLFFGLFVCMLYVATERTGWVVLGGAMFVTGALVAYKLFWHVQVRVESWLHPFDNVEQNHQIIQAQYGLAYGGLLGKGWGLGRPQSTPLPRSDFIAASLGEELGIAGLMAIILIYAILVARGLRMALSNTNEFIKMLACGLSFLMALQVFVIIGGVTRLLPLTGLTTPFMSQGGSSLIANWMIIGLLVAISHEGRKPVELLRHDPEGVSSEDSTQVVALGGAR